MKLASLLSILLFVVNASGQSIQTTFRKIYFDELSKEIKNENDTLVLVNFWATWCQPCVAELPAFEKMHEKFVGTKVKIVLVNLDFNSKVEKDVIPFINRKKIKSNVVHILNTDPNEWINNIDSNWSGAIPATVIYHKNKKLFFREGSVSEEELTKELNKALKNQ